MRARPTGTARRGGVTGPHAPGNAARHVMDDRDVKENGSHNRKTTPATTSTDPSAPSTGPRCRGNDTTRNTGRNGRQIALAGRSTRTDERVTVQGPVKKPQPDGMSHGGSAGAVHPPPPPPPPGVSQLRPCSHRTLGGAGSRDPCGAPDADQGRRNRVPERRGKGGACDCWGAWVECGGGGSAVRAEQGRLPLDVQRRGGAPPTGPGAGGPALRRCIVS